MAYKRAAGGAGNTPGGNTIIFYWPESIDQATGITTWGVRLPFARRYLALGIGGRRDTDITPPTWDPADRCWHMTDAALAVLLDRAATGPTPAVRER